MALQWRLRHKLVLGLLLVSGTIALLLGGTLQALSSYMATMNTTNSKLDELQQAEKVCRAVDLLLTPPIEVDLRRQDEASLLLRRSGDMWQSLLNYTASLCNTLTRKDDPDQGMHQMDLIEDLKKAKAQFDTAVQSADAARVVPEVGPRFVRDEPGVRAAFAKLYKGANELRVSIYDGLYHGIDIARRQHRQSLIIAIAATSLGILFTITLGCFFYNWVFSPIKQLQQGVQRVAAGDFDVPIDLRSGDELQELAAAFNDMTAKLQATYRDMARQINERSRQLVRSERLVSVGFLAAGVAHEINNPLASIAFCAEALERRVTEMLGHPPAEGETVAKYLKMIQSEAYRCKEITQRLLQFSRGGDRREATELGELVQAVLEIAQHLEACQGKRVIFQPSERLTATVNGQEVTQVILNLVVNALESMAEGGTLIITLDRRGPSAELVFADTGGGMSAEVLENIFEPFYTTKTAGRGTGLGLSISHLIIAQHGGEIAAASAGPGQGSTFTVALPLQPAESTHARPLRAAA